MVCGSKEFKIRFLSGRFGGGYMSYWTHITGTITVSPMGRTQAEKRYILETVLEHLPIVTGSERDMNVHIVQKAEHNVSSSCDEFGMVTNNLKDSYGQRSRRRGWLYTQDEYILVVEGDFRDRFFDDTYKEFVKWLCRLAKRVGVRNVLVNIDSDDKGSRVICENDSYHNAYAEMFENPSWYRNNKDKTLAWCEYLMWDNHKECDMPAKLVYKYYDDPENDKRVEDWFGYEND